MNGRVVLAAILTLAVVITGAYAWAFLINKPAATGGVTRDKGPSLAFMGVEIEGLDSGQKRWHLKARRVESGQQARSVRLVDITDGAIYRGGEPYFTFTAGDGVLQNDTGDLMLTGGVTVWSNGETLLTTDKVVWKAADGRILVPGPAEVMIEGSRISAQRFEADVDAEKITGHGEVVLQTEGQMKITAGTLVYRLDEKEVEMEEPVVIEFDIGS
ncbi:MAG: LPS export ABC transporter periplasmic protein LptC [Firmicutes bacterium]|nr:LPS export ABC transporter periplasmic protein LptC [Bacillota bacterium]